MKKYMILSNAELAAEVTKSIESGAVSRPLAEHIIGVSVIVVTCDAEKNNIDPNLCDDVAQETFIKISASMTTIDTTNNPQAFITSTARHVFIDMMRSAERYEKYKQKYSKEAYGTDERITEHDSD